MSYDELTPTSVIAAAGRLKGYVLRTPLDASRALSEASGASEVHLKLENLQRTGSFKIRGALNRLFTLDERERALASSPLQQAITHWGSLRPLPY